MENKRDCPVSGCSFRGNIESIVSHVERISNPLHSWSALGFDHPDLYRGNAFHQSGKEAFKEENFEEALILLEKAAQFFEEVLSTKDCSSKELFDQVSLLLELRDQAEKSKQEHDIDLLIDRAINHRDMGDSYYASDKIEAAKLEYDQAQMILEEAAHESKEVLPEEVAVIESHLATVQTHQARLELSRSNQELRRLVRSAQEIASDGNRAFREKRFNFACKMYQAAIKEFETISDHLATCSFNGIFSESKTCDLCQGAFTPSQEGWYIESNLSLTVCSACSEFGEDGILLTPRNVETEIRYLKENIDEIESENTGLEWTTSEGHSQDEVGADALPYDRREMLLELVGVVQSLGRVPKLTELDEHTKYGFIGYKKEFGSIEEALVEAGFNITE